jgi:4-hydroxybenzoate polyprenyltransferase
VTAWVILIGFGVAVAAVVIKVLNDVWRDLRADRAEHDGRITRAAARRAAWIVVIVLGLVLLLIVWPLVLGSSGDGN